MPDPSYIIEARGKKLALSMHLTHNFYPPIPQEIRCAFMDAFVEYWERDIDCWELEQRLREIGYTGGLEKYNFWQFLNDEDLGHG